MKSEPQYIEGPQALENFKALATTIFQASPQKKSKQTKKAIPRKKPKNSDRN